MANNKKKIQIDIEGDASSLDQATQQSKGYMQRVIAGVIDLISDLRTVSAQFIVFSAAAVGAFTQAAIAAYSLTANVVGLGVQLVRMVTSFLGLSVRLDSNNAKFEAASKLIEKFHFEVSISLGFLARFADALQAIKFPIQPLIDFINQLSKANIVLGIGRGKKLDLFDDLPEVLDRAKNSFKSFENALIASRDNLKQAFAKFGAAIAAETVIEWRGVKFESAFADVKKVVSGTVESLAGLRKELLDMSTEIAAPLDGLAKMQAVAGQLGFPTGEISDFVELVSKGSVAFELLPEQAAQSFGNLRNEYNLSLKELEYFGDQINYIADKANTNESALLDVLNRVGGSAQRFGLLRGETTALAAAMLSMGKPPELVGTAMDKLLSSMQNAEGQSKTFQAALGALGIDAKVLSDNVQKNPKKTLDDFLVTLSKLDARSQSAVLSGLIGQAGEAKGVIGDLVGKIGEYQRLSALSQNDDIAGSMTATFKERQKTVEAAIIMMKNAWDALAVSASSIFLPTVRAVVEGFRDLAVWLRAVNDEYPNLAAFMRIAVIFGTLGNVLSLLFRGLPAFMAGLGGRIGAAFAGGVVGATRAGLGGLTAIVEAIWSTVFGKLVLRLVASAAVVEIGFNGVLSAIGLLSSAFTALVSSPLALLLSGFVAVGVRIAMASGLFAGLGAAATGLGTVLLRLVGGPIGLIISALAFLIIKYNEIKDVQFQFGASTASLSEIISASWAIISKAVGSAVTAIGGYLKSFGGWLAELVGVNASTWQKIVDAMTGADNEISQKTRAMANTLVQAFVFIVEMAAIRMAEFVETMRVKLGNAVDLAQAAGRDISAALSGDFSFSGVKTSYAQGQDKGAAVHTMADESVRQSALKTSGTDYIDKLIGGVSKAASSVQADINEEIKKQRGSAKVSPPAETRPDGSGQSVDYAGGSGGAGKKAKTPKVKKEPEETDMHRFDLELENRKIAFEKENALLDFSKAQEKQYWVDVLATYKGNEKTRADIQKKISDLELQIIRESEKKKRELLKEQQQADYDAAAGDIAQKQAAAQQQQQLGIITQAELLALERQYAKESFAIALKLAQQKRDLTLAGTVERAQAENAILQVVRDGAQKESAIVNSQVLERKQRLDQLFAPLTNALDQSVNGILTGQQTLSNALRNTAQSITISYIQEALKRRAVLAQNWLFEKLGYAKVGAEKMATNKNVDIFDGLLWIGKKMRLAGQWAWDLLGFGAKETAKVGIKAGSETAQAGAVVAGETIKAGAVAVGEGVQTAAVAAGESQRSSITMLGTLKTIGAKAAQAAAGAFSWVMTEVPFPLNVILAPVAAAGAFLGTMAFGSMMSSKGGEWDVPEDRLQLVHKRETILPEWAAAPLRKLVMQGQPLAGGVSSTVQSATNKASMAYSTVSNTAGRKVTDTTESVKAIASTVSSLVSSTVQSATNKASMAYSTVSNTAGRKVTDTTESVKAIASTVSSLVSSTVQSATNKASMAYSTVSNTAGRKVTDTTESVKAIASTVSSLVSSTVQSVTDKASTAYSAVSNTAGRKVTDTTESVKAIASTVSSLVSSTVQSATNKTSMAYSTVSNTAGRKVTDTTESVKAIASTVSSLVSSTVQSVTDKTQSAYEVANKIKFAASGAVLPSNTRQIVADLALAGKIYPLQLPDSALAMRKTSAQAATQFAKEQYLVKRDQRKSDVERTRDRSKSGTGVQIVQLDINDFFGRHGNAIVKSVGKQLRNFNTGK